MFFEWRVIILCFLLLYGVPNSSTGAACRGRCKNHQETSWRSLMYPGGVSTGAPGQFPNSLILPGSLFPAKANDPNVQRAARFAVYKYNNSSNDIFLFKESRINKATIQIVKGVKYRLSVNICRTVCRKRTPHPNLDKCDFQKNKMLRKKFTCDFEVWLIPWQKKVQILVMFCH